MSYLPTLTQPRLKPLVAQFATQLAQQGFMGDILSDYSVRISYATDNSIYQQLPELALLPKCADDVSLTLKLLDAHDYRDLHVCARGGGTGTNGQSLTDGIVLDFSRHMNRIIEIDWDKEHVTVEPGVILSELNRTLSERGYFFAPDVSTANRATIGGMIANDSSGKGSRIYGKTSDHIIALTHVLMGGETVITHVATKADTPQSLHPLFDHVAHATATHAHLITQTYPDLDRGLTGYNLQKTRNLDADADNPQLNLNYIFSGAEGSLGLLTHATLKITKKPTHKSLVVITYASFEAALRQAPILLQAPVTAVETIDDTVASLAQNAPEWHQIKHILAPAVTTNGTFNLVECTGNGAEEVARVIAQLQTQLASSDLHTSVYITSSAHEMQALWSIRAKSVGLLGAFDAKDNSGLDPKPIAFIEDTAVHPDVLADYIAELRTILDAQGFSYGMFGHIDAGCLHVRPAIDMTDEAERAKIRHLSEVVLKLVRKYKGVFWGEHGKGYRAEFSKVHFGETLYQELIKIKQHCDPHNQLNRGKIMVAPNEKNIDLIAIDQVATRGERDALVPQSLRVDFQKAFDCNGNALCYNVSQVDVMCPSYKITQDRLQAPKGRASLMREWLTLLTEKSIAPRDLRPHPLRYIFRPAQQDMSAQVYTAMQGCLACKACTATCPVSVDIPTLKAQFLELYHTRYARPAKDYIIASIETLAPLLATMPKLINRLLDTSVARFVIAKFGLVDMPQVSETGVASLGAEAFYSRTRVAALSAEKQKRIVVIVQDAFSSFFDAQSVIATYKLLVGLGYMPLLLPFRPNGKAQYVKGFLAAFQKRVQKNAQWMQELDKLKLPMIGIEPSMTLTYRDEYQQPQGHEVSARIQTLPEWLVGEIVADKVIKPQTSEVQAEPHTLLLHCTERTHIPEVAKMWKNIFKFFDVPVVIEQRGCCGMAGTYGHESVHVENSKALFNRHWKDAFADNSKCMATGFSCRSQTKRMLHTRPPYPSEVLLERLRCIL